MPLPDSEKIVASAVKYLLDGGDDDAAYLLAACRSQVEWTHRRPGDHDITIILNGPRVAYDALSDNMSSVYASVRHALGAVVPFGIEFDPWRNVQVRAELIEPDPEWRIDAVEAARGKRVDNQANQIDNRPPILYWNHLGFRSEAERRVAIALDTLKVLFFPNCMARLNTDMGRGNREPDFLVCDRGKWGILEVDGAVWHQTAARDHDRDRLLAAYGIRVIQRYTDTRCRDDAPGVIREFLGLLAKNASLHYS